MIWYQNLQTNEIIKFTDIENVGNEYKNTEKFKKLIQQEIDTILIDEKKQSILLKLQNFYSQDSTWTMTVNKDGYTLQKTCNWFLNELTSFQNSSKTSKQFSLRRDGFDPVMIDITQEIAVFVSNFQDDVRTKLGKAYNDTLNLINKLKITEFDSFDIEAEFKKIDKQLKL